MPIKHKNPENAGRQQCAHIALLEFVARKLNKPTRQIAQLLESDYEGQFTDLLTDLQHLAAARGIDFGNRVRIATDNYQAELEEEPDVNAMGETPGNTEDH